MSGLCKNELASSYNVVSTHYIKRMNQMPFLEADRQGRFLIVLITLSTLLLF